MKRKLLVLVVLVSLLLVACDPTDDPPENIGYLEAAKTEIDKNTASGDTNAKALIDFVIAGLETDISEFPPQNATTYTMLSGNRDGFFVRCPFVESKQVDPIVHPGVNPAGHMHDFFGATVDENTTTNSLIETATTTCKHADDLSAYWAPSVYDDGVKKDPIGITFYYFTDKVDQAAIQTIPLGLQMIAGNAAATGPQPNHIMWWEEHQNVGNNTKGSSSMISANQTGQVVLRVNFPQCWTGVTLDSYDHKAHMAYASDGIGGVCPSTHPILLPQLTMFVRYDADGGSDFSISSGEWYTAHADFWNAWNPDTLQEIIDTCRYIHCDQVTS